MLSKFFTFTGLNSNNNSNSNTVLIICGITSGIVFILLLIAAFYSYYTHFRQLKCTNVKNETNRQLQYNCNINKNVKFLYFKSWYIIYYTLFTFKIFPYVFKFYKLFFIHSKVLKSFVIIVRVFLKMSLI